MRGQAAATPRAVSPRGATPLEPLALSLEPFFPDPFEPLAPVAAGTTPEPWEGLPKVNLCRGLGDAKT